MCFQQEDKSGLKIYIFFLFYFWRPKWLIVYQQLLTSCIYLPYRLLGACMKSLVVCELPHCSSELACFVYFVLFSLHACTIYMMHAISSFYRVEYFVKETKQTTGKLG